MLRLVWVIAFVLGAAACSTVFGLDAPTRNTVDAAVEPGLDSDDDGVADAVNCDARPNPGQEDPDDDGLGTACDLCPMVADDQHDEDGGRPLR